MASKKLPPLAFVEPPGTDDEEAPTEGASPLAAGDYSGQMQMLMNQLVDTPEQYKKNEILAWGGGLADPSGQGNLGTSIGNANRAELAFRMKDKELRAQYIPLIMNALGEGQKAKNMQILNEPLAGMPLERVYNITAATGKDLLPAWKEANQDNIAANTYRRRYNKKTDSWDTVYMGKPGDPVIKVDPDTLEPIEVKNVPGTATATGQAAGATAAGKAIGENLTGTTPVVKGGVKGIVPTREVNPLDVQGTLGAFESGARPVPTTASPPAPVPPQGPPAGGGTMPRPAPATGTIPTPQQGATTVPGADMPGVNVNAAGRPQVMPQAQALRDNDAVGALMAEAKKNQANQQLLQVKFQRLQQAGLVDDAREVAAEMERNSADLEGIQRELKSFTKKTGGMPPAINDLAAGKIPPAAAAPTAPKSNFIQTELSPGEVQINKNIGESTTRAGEEYKELIAKAKTFDQEDLNIRQLEQGLKGLGKTGDYSTAARVGVAKILAAAGVEADEKYMKNYQTVQQAVGARVNEKIMADRGVATEGDVARHREVEVNLKSQPAFNQYMVDVYKANLEMQKAKLDFYNRMYPRAERSEADGGDTGRVSRDWMAIKPNLFDMPSLQKYKPKGK